MPSQGPRKTWTVKNTFTVCFMPSLIDKGKQAFSFTGIYLQICLENLPQNEQVLPLNNGYDVNACNCHLLSKYFLKSKIITFKKCQQNT